ncbi:MAG: hypothetical protein HYT46_00950 [Candidatus Vogelbacteria bacterium]|nr:hypothetical protein [Candidatus Vogelbacteria bacterium]
MFHLPRWWPRGGIAFLVHPPNEYHIFTPLPFLRYLPREWVREIVKRLPPYRLGRLMVRRPHGMTVPGRLLTITIAPEHLEGGKGRISRPEAIRHVRREVRLAQRWGATIVGLGAYLPPFTRQGVTLLEEAKNLGVSLTTGHACTAYMIREYLYQLAERLDINLKREVVAIVGAAGSTGSIVARLLAHEGRVRRLLLIDLPQKEGVLESLAKECNGKTSTDLSALPTASVIITVTTAPGSIITPEHLGSSVVIIDDSKPRNTSLEVLRPAIECGQLLVVDVLAEVPGLEVTYHYDLDFARPEITYTCLAEVCTLYLTGWRGNYSLGDISVPQVLKVGEMTQGAGIRPAPLISFTRPMDEEEIERFLAHRREVLPQIRPRLELVVG